MNTNVAPNAPNGKIRVFANRAASPARAMPYDNSECIRSRHRRAKRTGSLMLALERLIAERAARANGTYVAPPAARDLMAEFNQQ